MGPVAAFLQWSSTKAAIQTSCNTILNQRLVIVAVLAATTGFVFNINDYLSKQFHNNWIEDDSWNWDEEIVLVTGGSSGIGAKVAQRLLELNKRTRIIIVDYSPLTFTPPTGSRLHYYQCDLSKSDKIRATCASIREEVGDPTVVFNNAGLTRGATVMEGSYTDVEITFRTNIIAPFLILKEFIPAIVKRNHGHIIGTSSMSALIPPAGLADYGATKSGLITLHEVCVIKS
jgi:NAD(P)-dependent dehydrogenase (short-subunit alcohol dehydrogenase family)